MSDKFLGYGQGSVNLTNGSATIFSATLGAASLTASKPVKTNSVKQLVSANLDIPDINNLQTQLNEKDELTFVEDDTHNNPPSGKVKIYAKTDGGIYKLDSSGNETSLGGGGGGVSTTNPPVLDNALVFYDGTDGTKIKQIDGIYYDSLNSALQVDDLETSATFSLNDELQKISNITVDPLTPLITDFQGEIHVAKIKSASHNTELEFEAGGSATLTSDADIQLVTGAGDIQLNGNSITLACPVNNLTYNGDNVVAIDANNVNIGVNAGNNLNTGTDNILIGLNAGVSMTDTFQNIAIGQSALSSITNEYADAVAIGDLSQQLTTGLYNVSVGKDTLRRTTTGQYNTAVGTLSTAFNTTGNNNTAIGYNTLNGLTFGDENTCVGSFCGTKQTIASTCVGFEAGKDLTGSFNTAVGWKSLRLSSAVRNTAVGSETLLNNSTGEYNTAIGSDSGVYNSTGNRNTYMGSSSGQENATGDNNTFLGYDTGASIGLNPSNSTALGAFSSITASNQIVLGNPSITQIVSGSDGLCDLGSSSKKFNNIYGTTYHEGIYSGSLIKNFPVGSNNTFSFITTPPDLTSGDNNTFYGLYAGDNVEISNSSTCIGVNAMRNSADAVDRSENTIVGKNAGQGTFASTFKGCTMIGMGAGSDQTTGDNNTLIGYNATTQGGNKTNSIAIGYAATALNDNQCCIGNASIEKIYNLGDGTCDLGASSRQFKDLYMTGNIIGSSLPITTRFRITKTPDRPPTTGNAIYEDDYIRLGWDASTQNDVQFQKKTSAEYMSTCSVSGTTSVNVSSLTNSNTTYELNGGLSFVGGNVMTIRISPTSSDTLRCYRIEAHYTEDNLGIDGNIDFIVERFDKCSLV